MRQSELFLKTQKASPADEPSKNAELLVRAGFVDKLMAGSYTFLPLGLRVLCNIEEVVRQEMNAIGAQEVLMPLLHPKALWEESGRWDKADEIIFKVKKDDREFALAWTHEEVVIDLLRRYSLSYRDLPLALYHFSNKFRNEPRARSGLLRGIEFRMKDLYSLHADENEMLAYYEKVKGAYQAIFKRLSLPVRVVKAHGGLFTEGMNQEFQLLAPTGEDRIFYCAKCDWAQNAEIGEGPEVCPECRGAVKETRAIEVGHVFTFGSWFGEKMSAFVTREGGERDPLWLASYGIGTSRLVGAIVEVSSDARGIIWPMEAAPFRVHLIDLQRPEVSSKVYDALVERGIEVLYDDRQDVAAGEKFAEADLVGIPYRVVVSEKTGDEIECKRRESTDVELLSTDKLISRLTD
jgi:prolyl-tRNA synthetase